MTLCGGSPPRPQRDQCLVGVSIPAAYPLPVQVNVNVVRGDDEGHHIRGTDQTGRLEQLRFWRRPMAIGEGGRIGRSTRERSRGLR